VLRVGRLASLARIDLAPQLALALRQLRHDPPHVLHLHTPNPIMLPLAWRCPAPLVVTHHSDIIRQRLLYGLLRPLERVVYARADCILTTSPAYTAGSAALQGFQEKVCPLPLGLDLGPFFRPSAAARTFAGRLRAGGDGPLWLLVGRLTYYKAVPVALEALRRVPGRLLVVGRGPLEAELRQRAEQLGVAGRVLWHGHANSDELVGAYRAATALWFPSNARTEGFGLVQVEAMASGCPVINAAIPASGVTWVCRDREEGLTVPVNDPVALAVAARQLLDDARLRERLARAARARAREEFGHTLMARRSLDIYEQVLSGRLPQPRTNGDAHLAPVRG
jgi:rhamnosyl/mannosyltransferase